MLIIERATIPGKVFATHRDTQIADAAVAYPAADFAIWQGTGSIVRPKLDEAGVVPLADIPAGFAVIRPAVAE